MFVKSITLCVATLFASFVYSASNTCSSIPRGSNIDIKRSPALAYLSEQNNYWSTGCGALKPACILYPSSAEEVAAILKVLGKNNETFVLKSGGHNPNQHFASIDGGPLISTKNLNEVVFDREVMTVRVGPGNRWEDVHKALQGTNVTVVGGRIGNVGVGGYILGGGLSFLSAQYGWAANNIVEFEVVLANATIVTASETSHPDLYQVLKGGGNSYGIVTAYTMVAHPQGKVWGGNLVFTGDKAPKMLAALRDFTEHYPDEKAGIIMTAEIAALGAVDLWIMFLFYDGPTPPANVFKNFTDIGPFTNNCKTRSYYDLLSFNNWSVVKGSVYTIATETTPLPNATVGAEVLGAYYSHWRNTTKSVFGVSGVIGSVAFQPMPKLIARKAKERGGDLMNLDDSVDRIIMEFDYSYWLSLDDAKMDDATQRLYSGMRNLITGYTDSGHLPKAYLPLFQNDGYFRQDYFGRLNTVSFARSVREQYDPQDLFADRTGGFKM
ncbi:FAD binding domain-containing protein [Clohesyomyces aquaticus]|uniref:FAD binding domain-containing protein n=1 Tax=Clohesyomyces aquaticus TaxID=1231657 RepID=A0A1Y1ZEX0_9PLEO|nr:FAD binding domain-containing protein [Clohesyomyces aquaticus]